MADNLTHSWSGSGSQGRSSADSYTWTVDFSTINAKAREKIPPYSKITAATLTVKATHDPAMNLASSSRGELHIRFTDSSNNSKLNLVSDTNANWPPKSITNTINLLAFSSPSYASTYRLIRDQTSDAGALYFSGATRLYHYSYYKYTWNQGFGFESTVTWTYNEPRAIVTVEGGTGGGTYHWGSTYTIKPTVPEGYKFVKWSDGDTNETRTFTVNSSLINAYETKKTYTAVFEKTPPEFTSAEMTYLNKQISASNKVICGEGFIISVGIT